MAFGLMPSPVNCTVTTDPASPKNYRPVSLLPIISRIVEVMVKKQVTTYLDSHSLLPASQFAYRKNHSTEDALALAVNRWSIAKSQRKFTGIVFVDMSKAFDRVRHERMIAVLLSFGISGMVLRWFCSYLTDRTQIIKVQGKLSDPVACSRGVPQGSVLGPLLFVLYTANIHRVLPEITFHQEFADDIVVDCSHADPAVVTTSLTKAVSDLATWLDDIGLLLNSAKTQLLMIKPRGALDITPQVHCGTVLLHETKSTKYLGVFIDSDLSWGAHVDHVARKTAQSIGQLWRHGRALSLQARRTWFLSMVQSQLAYGCTSFFPGLSAHLLGRIERMFKAGIRATLQQRMLAPTAPMLALLGIAPVRELFTVRLLLLVYRCLTGSASPLLQPLFCQLAGEQPNEDQRATRGQGTRLLRVPFLPGPAGRSSLAFRGSILWNGLPAGARTARTLPTFRTSLNVLNLE